MIASAYYLTFWSKYNHVRWCFFQKKVPVHHMCTVQYQKSRVNVLLFDYIFSSSPKADNMKYCKCTIFISILFWTRKNHKNQKNRSHNTQVELLEAWWKISTFYNLMILQNRISAVSLAPNGWTVKCVMHKMVLFFIRIWDEN